MREVELRCTNAEHTEDYEFTVALDTGQFLHFGGGYCDVFLERPGREDAFVREVACPGCTLQSGLEYKYKRRYEEK